MTGNKFNDKLYKRHTTGRPGSMKVERFKDLQAVGRAPPIPTLETAGASLTCCARCRRGWPVCTAAPALAGEPGLDKQRQWRVVGLTTAVQRRLCETFLSAAACFAVSHRSRGFVYTAAHPGAHHREGGEGHAHSRPPGEPAVPPHEGARRVSVAASPRLAASAARAVWSLYYARWFSVSLFVFSCWF